MAVVLQGNLQYVGAQELLLFLCQRDGEGTLDLESAGRRVRITFRDGTVIHAESGSGTTAADAVFECFGWTEGTFTLLDAAVVPDGAPLSAIAVSTLAAEWEQRQQGPYSDDALFEVIDSPATGEHINLSAIALKLLLRISSGRTFGQLLSDFPIARTELARHLTDLEALGLLKVSSPEKLRGSPPEATPQHTLVNVRVPPSAPALVPQTSAEPTLIGSLTPDARPDEIHPLLEQQCSIGRAGQNDIVIADSSVSSHHARIVRSPAGFTVEDSGSRNGTYVNGEKVSGSRDLADGDMIRFGKVVMTFNVAAPIEGADSTASNTRS